MAALAVVVGAPLLAGGAMAPAAAKGGPAGGTGSWYYFNDSFSGTANRALQYGEPGDVVFSADTDGDGDDSLLIRRGNQFFVRTTLTSGPAETTFTYGDPGDTVLVGDWDGDGLDTLAVRRGNQFLVKNTTTSGPADVVFGYGDPGDTVLVGDWDGDGDDTLAVRRGNVFYVKNTTTTGVADVVFGYGDPSDSVLVGDWDGDGEDTLAVRRGNIYYLKNSTSTGVADVVFGYGETTDTVLVGDWDGDGTTTLAVRRALPAAIAGGTAVRVGSDVSPGLYRATGPFAPATCDFLFGRPGEEETYVQNFGDQVYIELVVGETFSSSPECGTWEYNRTGPLRAVPVNGDSLVGADVAAGTYAASGADCFAAVLTSFRTDAQFLTDVVAGEQVTLADGQGIVSDLCTWTPVVP